MELHYEHVVDMEVARRCIRRMDSGEYNWLYLLLLLTVALHLAVISFPAEPMLDEQHYVPDVRSILQEQGTTRSEHPPLGRLFITAGVKLFGDNPWGWRLFSVIFGTVNLVLFFILCRQLKLTRRAAYLATFLLAFENLTFVHAGIGMLDVFLLTYMLLGLWLYLRGDYLLCGVAVALAALVKLTGICVIPIIGLHWILLRRDRPAYFIGGLLLFVTCFLLLLPVLNYPIFRELHNPLEDIRVMLNQSSSITFESAQHPSQSRPWEWIYLPLMMPYWWTPHYLGVISYTVWALVLPSMAYVGWKAWKRYDLNSSIFLLAWFAGSYLVWIPISLITDRVSYVYYFYPTVPAICIAIGLGLARLLMMRQDSTVKAHRVINAFTISYLALHLLVFAVLGPFTSWA